MAINSLVSHKYLISNLQQKYCLKGLQKANLGSSLSPTGYIEEQPSSNLSHLSISYL